MRKAKILPCPGCGAQPQIERPFFRVIKVLWRWVELPIPIWAAECSEMCDSEMEREVNIYHSKQEAIKVWNEYAAGGSK